MIFHPRMKTLSRYVDKQFGDEKRMRLEQHLAKCEACRIKTDFFKEASPASLPPAEKIEALSEGILQFPDIKRPMKRIPVIGEIENIAGDVFVQGIDDDEAIEAFPKMALKKGDVLTTQRDGRALIRLLDGSVLYVNKDTSLDFATERCSLSLTIGEIFMMMKPQKESFTIKTPSALLGVIGTEFDTEATKDKQTILKVVKGSVYYKNDSGESVVKKNRQVEAANNIKPVPVKLREKAAISDWTGQINISQRKGGFIMKKVFIIIGALIALLVVGALGFYFYDEYFNVPTSQYAYQTKPAATSQGDSQPSTAAGNQAASQNASNAEMTLSRPPFEIGSKAVFQVDQKTVSTSQVPGMAQPIKTTSIVSQKISIYNKEKLPGDIHVAEFRFLSMNMGNEGMGEKMIINTDAPQPTVEKDKPIWNVFKIMCEMPLYFHINKKFEVEKIEGIDKMLEKMRANCPEQILRGIETSFNEESLKSSFNIFGRILPEKPIKVGDTYDDSREMMIPMFGKTKVNMKYHFLRWEDVDGRKCGVIETDGTTSSKGAEVPSMTGMKMTLKDGSIKGMIYYSPEVDGAVKSELTQKIETEIMQKATGGNQTKEVTIPSISETNISTKLISHEKIQ